MLLVWEGEMGHYDCEWQNKEGQNGEEIFLAEQTNEAKQCVIQFWKKQLSLCRFIHSRGRNPVGAGTKV